jgi:hypothetical protein
VADTLGRGEQVVVELRAAEFVSGQVLSVGNGKVNVQTGEDADQIVADRGDVYRVTETIQRPEAEQYGVCRWTKDSWLGCQIERVDGQSLAVLSLAGERKLLRRDQVLQATPATSQGQDRLFKQARARGWFESEARAAGKPRRPAGWRPALGEAVLAKRGDEWLNARITGGADAGLSVSWSEQQRHQRLRQVEVVPKPPYPWLAPPNPGSFVLVAGAHGEPMWARVRVESATETDALVVDRDGAKRHVLLKEIVPLEH